MQQPKIKLTHSDYLLLPEQDRRELIGGEFHVVPAPSIRHQDVLANLGFGLREYVRSNGLGKVMLAPVDVVLSEEDVVQPDILFISSARLGILTEDNVRGAPDLVIEILSQSTADRDKQLKLGLYAKFGVKEYWIVDHEEESVRVLELGSHGYDSVRTYTTGKASSSVLAGFAIALRRVFAK